MPDWTEFEENRMSLSSPSDVLTFEGASNPRDAVLVEDPLPALVDSAAAPNVWLRVTLAEVREPDCVV